MASRNTTLHGECECCDKVDVDLIMAPSNIAMCASCYSDDSAARAATRIIESSHKVDDGIVTKVDVFNAATVAFNELEASIQQNPSIADDQKYYTLVTEAARRIDVLNAAIFSEEQALMDKKDERRAMLISTQNAVAKLRIDQRAKFAQYNVNYQPATPKSTKPKAVKAPSDSTYKRTELNDAAKKYGVDASGVRMVMLSKNLTAESAARHMAEMLGLIKSGEVK